MQVRSVLTSYRLIPPNRSTDSLPQIVLLHAMADLHDDVTYEGSGSETSSVVSHQRPLPLRPAASTVIVVFRAMTRTLLIAAAP